MFKPAILLLAAMLANVPASLYAQNLVGYWVFDGQSSTQVADISGYGNDGEPVGSLADGEGVRGQGIVLDGAGARVEVPASSSLDDLSAFTFAAWVKTADDSNQIILAKDERLSFLKIGAFRNYIKGCVRVGPLVCSRSFDDVVAVGEWAFVVMSYDDSADRKVRLYVDGEEIAYRREGIAKNGRTRTSDSGTPLAIGSAPTSGKQPFNGLIDEVRVFSDALNAAQIRGLFEDDMGAPAIDRVPPLVAIADPGSDLILTQETSIDLAGTAVDSSGIVDVVWSTSRGEFGDAVGGANWVAANVPLHPDENVIDVTARDAAGNAGTTSMRVFNVADTAQDFEGFGAATSGGSGFPSFDAASPAELEAILKEVNGRGGNAVITFSGSWEYTSNVPLAHVQNVTLDATGADVTIRNSSLIVLCSENVIIQGLRVRNDQRGGDAIQINSSRRVVLDHNSASGAGDGNIDITGWSCGPSSDVTVSWNIFADTWKQSLVAYGGTTNISVHHNLFYNSGNRLPALNTDGKFDIRNNVFWQWGSSGTSLRFGATANLIGNVYEVGRRANRGHAAIWYRDDSSKAWIADNILPGAPRAEKDVSRLDAPVSVPATTTHAPDVAMALILENAGASPRDHYDEEVTHAVANGTFPVLPPFHD